MLGVYILRLATSVTKVGHIFVTLDGRVGGFVPSAVTERSTSYQMDITNANDVGTGSRISPVHIWENCE